MVDEATTRPRTPRAAGNDELLRFALKLDGTVSGLVAALSMLGASALDALLGLPAWLHWAQGVFLTLYAAVLWYAGTRPAVIRAIGVSAVVLNAVWAAGCLAIIAVGKAWFPITPFGYAYVVFLGVAVMVFGALQYAGLERAK
ncbi:hypothetical protein [Streptomyces sp. NPDC058773]|uniref:hypothetical protein n=1 Tax=Streptomyces sp. NPDC058773 TaxID=3346632 RepID=UPI003680235B